MTANKIPPLELRLRVLSAVDYAPGNSIRARIKQVSKRSFKDEQTDCVYQFTWRTISTWLYRFKKNYWTYKLQGSKRKVNFSGDKVSGIFEIMDKNIRSVYH